MNASILLRSTDVRTAAGMNRLSAQLQLEILAQFVGHEPSGSDGHGAEFWQRAYMIA